MKSRRCQGSARSRFAGKEDSSLRAYRSSSRKPGSGAIPATVRVERKTLFIQPGSSAEKREKARVGGKRMARASSVASRGSETDVPARRREKSGREKTAPRRSAPSPEIAPRGKRITGRKINGKRVTLAFLLLASCALLIWVYLFSEALKIDQIEVRGNNRLEASYICSLAGVGKNTNLIRADTGRIVSNLKQEPWVEEVQVSKNFPSRLVLEIKEREPIFQVLTNHQFFLVDGSGFVISMESEPLAGIPQLNLIPAPELEVTGTLQSEEFHWAAEAYRYLPQGLKSLLVGVSVVPGKGVTLFTSAGYSIILGSNQDLERKIELAVLILGEVARKYRRLEYIDVSMPDNPVIKPH